MKGLALAAAASAFAAATTSPGFACELLNMPYGGGGLGNSTPGYCSSSAACKSPRWDLDEMCINAGGGCCQDTPPEQPTMPTRFSVLVSVVDSDGRTEYDWHFDLPGMREAMSFSTGQTNSSAVKVYHNTSQACNDDSCCTIYTWATGSSSSPGSGPGSGDSGSCHASNTSDVQQPLWGWLTDDQFTHEKATFLGRDRQANHGHGCDLWQHNEKPLYPSQMTQTACVSSAPPPVGLAPVYMMWLDKTQSENKTFSNFRSYPAGTPFPPGTFHHPKNCNPATAPAGPAAGGAASLRHEGLARLALAQRAKVVLVN